MLLLSSGAGADGLYWIGAEDEPGIPLKWISGLDVGYQDHVVSAGTGQSVMEDTPSVTAPPMDDVISGTLWLDLDAHYDSGNGGLLPQPNFVGSSELASGADPLAVVPEPSMALLAGVGAGALLRRRRSA